MNFEDKIFLTIVIIGFTGFSFFMGHEFGMSEGIQHQKIVNSKTLENCNRLLVGQIYE